MTATEEDGRILVVTVPVSLATYVGLNTFAEWAVQETTVSEKIWAV